MAIDYPHIEDSTLTHYIPPKGEYEHFKSEEDYAEKAKEWGLSSAKEAKKEFWYKGKTYKRLVTIKGFQRHGLDCTVTILVIEFQDGCLSCIYPDYLKDMQSANFGRESRITSPEAKKQPGDFEPSSKKETVKSGEQNEAIPAQKSAAPKAKKTIQPAIELPEGKVHFTAVVKQFALSWNHFSEENDEIVVFKNVQIVQEEPVDIELAWCSHSKTLKKLELQPEESLEFDGKIVKKSFPKGKDVDEEFTVDVPVRFKINNPSKLIKK
ncbi:hypothetical protein [Domibacillus robiginosus]|uniref:hypothetical protein n=1 Tax=Domibacillus robiginosus TaxID=1071054 RepID=UPI00067A967E|nr:hypothetical protein [Domibacillus robiginosus]